MNNFISYLVFKNTSKNILYVMKIKSTVEMEISIKYPNFLLTVNHLFKAITLILFDNEEDFIILLYIVIYSCKSGNFKWVFWFWFSYCLIIIQLNKCEWQVWMTSVPIRKIFFSLQLQFGDVWLKEASNVLCAYSKCEVYWTLVRLSAEILRGMKLISISN